MHYKFTLGVTWDDTLFQLLKSILDLMTRNLIQFHIVWHNLWRYHSFLIKKSVYMYTAVQNDMSIFFIFFSIENKILKTVKNLLFHFEIQCKIFAGIYSERVIVYTVKPIWIKFSWDRHENVSNGT